MIPAARRLLEERLGMSLEQGVHLVAAGTGNLDQAAVYQLRERAPRIGDRPEGSDRLFVADGLHARGDRRYRPQ